MSAILAILAAACSGGSDSQAVDEQLVQAESLVDTLGLSVVDDPRTTESKSVRYVSSTATLEGDQQGVVGEVTSALSQAGWVVRAGRTIDVGQSPATEGHEVIAERGGLVVRLAVFDRIGDRQAPEGTRWVQLSIAAPDPALAWTQE